MVVSPVVESLRAERGARRVSHNRSHTVYYILSTEITMNVVNETKGKSIEKI